MAQRGHVEAQQRGRRRRARRARGVAFERTLGQRDERIGGIGLDGFAASLGPGFGEHSILFGAQRGADPGPGIGSELPFATVGALGVGPAAHIAGRVDPPVARELVVATRGVGLHACRVLLEPREPIGMRPIQQVTLGMGRLRRGRGDLPHLRLGEPPRPELLFGPGQLGESTRRLHHPDRLADTGPARCSQQMRRGAVPVLDPDPSIVDPLDQQRLRGHAQPLDLHKRLEQLHRVARIHALGLQVVHDPTQPCGQPRRDTPRHRDRLLHGQLTTNRGKRHRHPSTGV